jgi:hypothetical protein
MEAIKTSVKKQAEIKQQIEILNPEPDASRQVVEEQHGNDSQ